jgi:hypothetical protein
MSFFKRSRREAKQPPSVIERGSAGELSIETDYIAPLFDFFPSSSAESVIYRRDELRIEQIPDHLVPILTRLERWRPLEEHIRTIAGELRGIEPEHILEALGEIRGLGLLLSRQELFARAGDRVDPDRPVNIPTLLWCSADRPDSLAVNAAGYIANCAGYGRHPGFRVYGNSKNTGMDQEYRKRIAELASKIPYKTGPIAYIGPLEQDDYKKQLLDELGDTATDRGMLDFALIGGHETIRNLVLLHSAGECFISTDDDTESRFAPPPGGADPGLELCSANTPCEMHVFESRERLLESSELLEVDIIAEYEKLLGRPAASLIAELPAPAALGLERCGSGLTNRLMREEVKVGIATAGTAGDSGMSNSRALLALQGADRERLLSSGDYRAKRLSREIIRISRGYALCEGAAFMSCQYALDDRTLPPPFMPRYRNGDGVFGNLYKASRPGALFGHLPWGVYHNPPMKRANTEESFLSWSPRVSDAIILLVQSFDPGPYRSPADRLTALGTYLRTTAHMPADDFFEYLRLKYLPHVVEYVDTLSASLDHHRDEAAEWAADVEAHVGYIREHLEEPGFFLPAEVRTGSSIEDGIIQFRNFTENFGTLLECWPAIWEAAMRINTRKRT